MCPVPGSWVALVTGDSMPAAADEGAGGAGAVRRPCAHIYSSLCHRGKGLFVSKKRGCAQGSSFQCISLQNVHRMHSVRALKGTIEKLFSFQFHVYFTGSCHICQEILPSLFSDPMAFLYRKMSNIIFHTVGII